MCCRSGPGRCSGEWILLTACTAPSPPALTIGPQRVRLLGPRKHNDGSTTAEATTPLTPLESVVLECEAGNTGRVNDQETPGNRLSIYIEVEVSAETAAENQAEQHQGPSWHERAFRHGSMLHVLDNLLFRPEDGDFANIALAGCASPSARSGQHSWIAARQHSREWISRSLASNNQHLS